MDGGEILPAHVRETWSRSKKYKNNPIKSHGASKKSDTREQDRFDPDRYKQDTRIPSNAIRNIKGSSNDLYKSPRIKSSRKEKKPPPLLDPPANGITNCENIKASAKSKIDNKFKERSPSPVPSRGYGSEIIEKSSVPCMGSKYMQQKILSSPRQLRELALQANDQANHTDLLHALQKIPAIELQHILTPVQQRALVETYEVMDDEEYLSSFLAVKKTIGDEYVSGFQRRSEVTYMTYDEVNVAERDRMDYLLHDYIHTLEALENIILRTAGRISTKNLPPDYFEMRGLPISSSIPSSPVATTINSMSQQKDNNNTLSASSQYQSSVRGRCLPNCIVFKK